MSNILSGFSWLQTRPVLLVGIDEEIRWEDISFDCSEYMKNFIWWHSDYIMGWTTEE
jgi:hypothetical protein